MCTRLTRGEVRSCRGDKGGRNYIKTISLLKEKKGEEEEQVEKKTSRDISNDMGKLSKQKCARKCVHKNAQDCECAHTLPGAVHRGAVKAQASTQTGAWVCKPRFGGALVTVQAPVCKCELIWRQVDGGGGVS